MVEDPPNCDVLCGFGSQARLRFIIVIDEVRMAGLDTIDIQNILANRNLDLNDAIRPDMGSGLTSCCACMQIPGR